MVVYDHLIITPNSYLSCRDSGLLKKLSKSLKWRPMYEIKEQIRQKERERLELMLEDAEMAGEVKGFRSGIRKGTKHSVHKEDVEKERVKASQQAIVDIARLMKAEGETHEKIEHYTQLSQTEIEAL